MQAVKGQSKERSPNWGGPRPGSGRKRATVTPIGALTPAKRGPKPRAQSAPEIVPLPPAAAMPAQVEPPQARPAPVAPPPTPIIPPMSAAEAAACRNDPLEFLRAVWSGRQDASPTQIRAAAAALPFLHKKLGEGGKKDETQRAAEKVASRFAPVSPPKRVIPGEK
jgi:hypothetical protein